VNFNQLMISLFKSINRSSFSQSLLLTKIKMVEQTYTLDKTLFDRKENATAVYIPVKEIGTFQKQFKPFLIQRSRVKPVLDGMVDGKKLLVMQESLGKDPSFLEFIDKTGYKVVDGHQI
jgi:hypothetical protein